MPNTLFLKLEGPLQAWGERARWSVRDSASEPTKSGVVGLLGCALGIGDDAALRNLSGQLRMAVRIDQPGSMIRDYHTIVGGVLAANGKIKINANTKQAETVVTWRQYLCDACFVVALQSSDPALIQRLALAVQQPFWPVYLGRKSCPPTCPPFAGTGDFENLEAALMAFPLPAQAQGSLRAVIECTQNEGVRRRDEIDSRSARSFLPRYTREILISMPETAKGV